MCYLEDAIEKPINYILDYLQETLSADVPLFKIEKYTTAFSPPRLCHQSPLLWI